MTKVNQSRPDSACRLVYNYQLMVRVFENVNNSRERSERTSLVYRAPADKLSKAENNMITFSCRLGGATCNKTDFPFHEVSTWSMQNLILHVQSKQAFPYPVGAEPLGGYSKFRVTGMIEGFFWV